MSEGPAWRPLEWDSDFWGFPVAAVSSDLDADGLRRVVSDCDEEGVRCAYLLVAAADAGRLAAAQGCGFRFVDTRIELRRDEAPGDDRTPTDQGVRPGGAGDLTALEEIARASFRSTRFFADGRFDEERCRELYAAWVRRRLEGPDGLVVVAERDGAPAGFMAGHLDPGSGEGRQELVAVASEHRREGLAGALSDALSAQLRAAGAGFEGTATQAANLPGLRMFTSLGFRIAGFHHWLHRWRS